MFRAYAPAIPKATVSPIPSRPGTSVPGLRYPSLDRRRVTGGRRPAAGDRRRVAGGSRTYPALALNYRSQYPDMPGAVLRERGVSAEGHRSVLSAAGSAQEEVAGVLSQPAGPGCVGDKPVAELADDTSDDDRLDA